MRCVEIKGESTYRGETLRRGAEDAGTVRLKKKVVVITANPSVDPCMVVRGSRSCLFSHESHRTKECG